MRRRIKQLIDEARNPTTVRPVPAVEYSKELELAIKADFLAGSVYTYAKAAEKFGCSPEKMRQLAQGYPISRAGRTHLIPESVFKLIVRDNTIRA